MTMRALALRLALALALVLAFAQRPAFAQEATPRVIDIPTREGVTQRFLYLAPPAPKAIAVLYAGGHGGLQIGSNGTFGWGRNNFLVRARQYFLEEDVAVAIVDAPSDRLSPPWLTGFARRPSTRPTRAP
ncbi:hypothetical protein [Paraburkholderia acidisoli]|uniref:hypothetical protein n=1 Tax=Paraburkholderia acidisoli TaxID=2571748 RepID=UPI001E338786|nr:hypothetical protein [Paraburkholderia acidisoli]